MRPARTARRNSHGDGTQMRKRTLVSDEGGHSGSGPRDLFAPTEFTVTRDQYYSIMQARKGNK